MIHWLLQSSADHAALAAALAAAPGDAPGDAPGRLPGGLLTDVEAHQFAALKTAKRRHDWLLGRWTAKRLLQAVTADQRRTPLPLDAFAIYNRDNGAPVVLSRVAKTLDLTLSISHAGSLALCAAIARANWPLGADLERVEPRDQGFVTDFFTAPEISLVAAARPEDRDTLVTAIWSAKEAALKALQLGLSVDTRAVSCDPGPFLPAEGQWLPLTLFLDPERLGPDRPALVGWWSIRPGYVLTLAAQPLERMAPIPVPTPRGERPA